MNNVTVFGDAGRKYAAAHATHYGARDLSAALRLYSAVRASHPGSTEADYSRTQIQNIINAVVPKGELLEAQIGLAIAHLGSGVGTRT